MWPQTSVGIVSSEREPELVAEHRDGVAGVLVVSATHVVVQMRGMGAYGTVGTVLLMIVHDHCP